ncbi:hypothetical protein O181_089781 [Austropuccinia psidii MF-1]|uniref:Uncharacterized protein n=1 Tax=Austropuccinia psidii MF-1 TaxID=1389203 RepID=A0A9Q3IU89_9BASI|nr:hypothetical protein [Austropuccinia psidii MF-1]
MAHHFIQNPTHCYVTSLFFSMINANQSHNSKNELPSLLELHFPLSSPISLDPAPHSTQKHPLEIFMDTHHDSSGDDDDSQDYYDVNLDITNDLDHYMPPKSTIRTPK